MIFFHNIPLLKASWVVPRFLLDWRRDVRPHIILKADLIEQLVQFCYAESSPVVIIDSLKDCIGTNGIVCIKCMGLH